MVVIAFAFFAVKPRWLRVAHKSLLCVACLYSLGAVSGSTLSRFNEDKAFLANSQKQVAELEAEIFHRRELRNRLVALDRLSSAGIYESKIDQLQAKLDGLRRDTKGHLGMAAIVLSVVVLIIFRGIALIANVLCVHRLSGLFKSKARARE